VRMKGLMTLAGTRSRQHSPACKSHPTLSLFREPRLMAGEPTV
jgi:hypothetical protein